MTEIAVEDFDPLALEITDRLNNESKSKSGTWEHEDLAQVRYKVLRGHKEGINSCQFCVNDTRILTASDDKSCSLWNVETGRCEKTYEGHPMCISQCHMSPDNTKFVSSCWDKRVRVWDVETGEVLWSVLQGGIVTCCQFSHNSRYIASGTDLDHCLTIWDAGNGNVIQSIKKHHNSTITSCKFSPNDSRICTTSMDMVTKLWDIASQSVTVKLGGHINIVSCCCFNKDERRLCTGSWDKQLQVWDVSTGIYRSEGPVTFSKGHEGSVSSCTFSEDGSMLVSGSYDQTVVVWDAENCGPKLTLKGHTDWVTDVDITQDMNWILSSSRDQTIRLWNIEDSDNIPVVLENKKNMGLKIVKCNQCSKPFSISQLDDPRELKMCVFCRLQSSRPLLNLTLGEDMNMPDF